MKQPIPFGKYLLLERINVGGMAEIFLARSRGLHGFKRLLAIKKILPTMAEDEEFIAMFVDEARIAAELSHANIVQIFELGRFESDYYIAMEFIHGKDLRYIQERKSREKKPMPVAVATFIGHKICEALEYAHNKKDPSGRPLGIIHRDVSPQNVIISYEGEIKICDFGIAKAANRSQKTQAGVLKGKFGYMSPEQVRGLPLDGRSDLFTVGTLIYEMLTLERLFMGESDFSTLEKVRNADVVPPSTYNREVPEELEDIILRALAKEVEDRFQNSAEFADALQGFLMKHSIPSSREVASFVKSSFPSEFDSELRRLEDYQNLPDSLLRAAAIESPVKEESDRPAEVDLDAKTLIFASSDEENSKHLAPPPIPPSRRNLDEQPDSPWDQATALLNGGLSNGAGDLAEAKTMIIADPDMQPDQGLHESPTKGAMPRPDLQLVKPGTQTAAAPRRSRSMQERLFIPLVLIAATLFGWALYLTIRSQENSSASSPPEFELITWPATGVKVSLDDQDVATVTPFVTRKLQPGVHRLRIQREGYEEVDRKFEFRPDTRMVMEVVLSMARPSPVDKKDTPQGSPDVPETITPEKRPEVSRPLKPVRSTVLKVDSDPPGARVLLDGKRIGKTPLSTEKIKGGKKYRLAVGLKGYRTEIRVLDIKAGQHLKIALPLTRQPRHSRKSGSGPAAKISYGYLVANTRPWSKVFVDGKYSGLETPIAPDKKLKLSAGIHKVEFETPEGKRFAFDVVIEAEKVFKLIKRLE